MPLDHYVTLGHSGLAVSPFCLGAMTFGDDWGWGSSVSESEAILDRYLGRGGNFIDTANACTRGHSEKIIGDHLGRHAARRDRVVIATKFSSNLFPGDPNAGGSSRKAIVAQCEESLRRLQTDYIDLWDAKPGRRPWVVSALTEGSFGVRDVVRRVAGELGTTPARVALAWVQLRPGVVSTLLGARSVAQLEGNLGALDLRLPAEAVAALDDISKPALNFPADFVRGSGMFKRGGTTVNGETAPPWPLAPKTDAERH